MTALYRFGRFELSPQTRQLLADGEPVGLGARAFDVLVTLVERRERLVSKEELFGLVWPGLVVEDNNLSVQISALRKALGSQAIATVPGRGYCFVAPLSGETVKRADKSAPKSADRKSIAVLPFANMSADDGLAYFADGIHEELLTQLALLGELKVISRASVLQYRESKKNARQIGVELGVGTFVEGSVRRDGNRVRISVQLIDASSDEHLWAETYDRELSDVFAIQAELATKIAQALRVSLSPRDRAQLARRPTENLEAYELFLRHRQLDTQELITARDVLFEMRIDLLSRATKLDLGFALAWAKLGVDHARVRFTFGDPNNDRLRTAQDSLDRALSLAPEDLEVRLQLGYLYHYGYQDFARAAEYLEALLQLAPNHVEMLTQLSHSRMRLGEWAEANALLHRALAIDGRNMNAAVQLRQNLLYFRHFDEGLKLQHRIVDIAPENLNQVSMLYLIEYFKSRSFTKYDAWRNVLTSAETQASEMVWSNDLFRALAARDLEGALRLLEFPLRRPGATVVAGWFVDSHRACALLALSRREEAVALSRAKLLEARETMKRTPDDHNLQYNVLIYLAILGERAAAVAELERWRDSARVRADAHLNQYVMAWAVHVFALLGDRDRALHAFARISREPNAWWKYAPIDPPLASLWDDEGFLAIALDPANNAPIPIENRGVPQVDA